MPSRGTDEDGDSASYAVVFLSKKIMIVSDAGFEAKTKG